MILGTIAQHAKKHNIHPLKKFGQNFIFDSSLCAKIAKTSNVQQDDHVLEVGPGTGGLTRALLALNPGLLTVIETDARMLPLLDDIKAIYSNLMIINEDALKCSLKVTDKKIKIVSNLPYNIGTVLIINWLKQVSLVQDITVMLQKEVAERICSPFGNKKYGRLSVLCQLMCETEICFSVSPKTFYPPPKIDSAVIKLIPKAKQLDINLILSIEKITHLAFSQRRKMIKTSLGKIENLNPILEQLDISSNLRAEELSPEQYLNIAQNALNISELKM